MNDADELKQLEAEELARREEYERRKAALLLLKNGKAPELAADAVAEMLQSGPPPSRRASRSGQMGLMGEIRREDLSEEDLHKAAYQPMVRENVGPIRRVFGYLCLSIRDRSPAELAASIQEYCAKRGWHLDGIFLDEAQHGTKRLIEQPHGREFDLYLQRGDQVILARHDRAFRDLIDMVNKLESWADRGVVTHICNWQISSDMSFWRLFAPIALQVREWEGRASREGIQRALVERKRLGQRWTRNAPPGCRWAPDPKGGRTRRGHPRMKLAVDPGQIKEMRRIAELHDEHGLSFEQIWRTFLYQGEKCAHTGAEWSLRSIAWRYDAYKKMCQTQQSKIAEGAQGQSPTCS